MPIAGIMECPRRDALFGLERGMGNYGFATREGTKASDCIGCGQCEAPVRRVRGHARSFGPCFEVTKETAGPHACRHHPGSSDSLS